MISFIENKNHCKNLKPRKVQPVEMSSDPFNEIEFENHQFRQEIFRFLYLQLFDAAKVLVLSDIRRFDFCRSWKILKIFQEQIFSVRLDFFSENKSDGISLSIQTPNIFSSFN